MFKILLAKLGITEAGAYLIVKEVIKEYDKTYVNPEDFEDWIDWKIEQAPDEMMERDSMDMSLYDRLILYKNGNEEPLDGDEVEGFIEMLRADVNKHEGNW